MIRYIALFALLFAQTCFADPSIEILKTKKTPLGELRFTLYHENGEERFKIHLRNKLLFESEHGLYDADFEPIEVGGKSLRRRVLIVEATGPKCPTRYYVLDFSGREAVVSNAFDNGRCSEFDWAAWGKKNSVIMLKYGSKFIYENGKVRQVK